MRSTMSLWILTKISILKAIHNKRCEFLFCFGLWILTKISILKAIHNTQSNPIIKTTPVNPH